MAIVRRITWIGLVGNLLIAAIKFAVGVLGSSQALVADAIHSLSDSTTDVAILLGVRVWTQPADEDHPYGHGRIETMITAAIGLVLVGVAAGVAYHALTSIREAHVHQPRWIAFWGAALSIFFKEALYRWTARAGRQARSAALMANAWHHRSDALSSIPAALAVVIAVLRPELGFVDHIGAVVVAFIILHAAWNIIRPTLGELADSAAPRETLERIEQLASGVEHVQSAHAIRTRRVGPGLHVDLHIMVPGTMSVASGHAISEEVGRRLVREGPGILDVLVHLEPAEDLADHEDDFGVSTP